MGTYLTIPLQRLLLRVVGWSPEMVDTCLLWKTSSGRNFRFTVHVWKKTRLNSNARDKYCTGYVARNGAPATS